MSIALSIFISCNSKIVEWLPPQLPDQKKNTAIDNISDSMVLINSVWSDSEYDLHNEVGTGVYVGVHKNTIYFITAAHVVYNSIYGTANKIFISLKQKPLDSFSCKLFVMDKKNDIAIISTNHDISNFSKNRYFKIPVNINYSYKKLNHIKAVGHPKSQKWHVTNTSIAEDISISDFKINREDIHFGNSGGPILDSDNRMIGMTLSIQGDYAFCKKINYIVELLQRVGIPYRVNFLGLSGDIKLNLSKILKNPGWELKKYSNEKLSSDNVLLECFDLNLSLFNPGHSRYIYDGATYQRKHYYAEYVGQFQEDFDEAWRIVVNILSTSLQNDYFVFSEQPEDYQFYFYREKNDTFPIFTLDGAFEEQIIIDARPPWEFDYSCSGCIFIIIGSGYAEFPILRGRHFIGLNNRLVDCLKEEKQ